MESAKEGLDHCDSQPVGWPSASANLSSNIASADVPTLCWSSSMCGSSDRFGCLPAVSVFGMG